MGVGGGASMGHLGNVRVVQRDAQAQPASDGHTPERTRGLPRVVGETALLSAACTHIPTWNLRRVY